MIILACYFHRVKFSECMKDTNTRQPSLLLFGAQSNIEQIFLQVEDYASPLTAGNITNALDILFKSYYAFNLEYPVPAVNFFLYLQIVIFGIKKDGKLPPRIREHSTAVQARM